MWGSFTYKKKYVFIGFKNKLHGRRLIEISYLVTVFSFWLTRSHNAPLHENDFRHVTRLLWAEPDVDDCPAYMSDVWTTKKILTVLYIFRVEMLLWLLGPALLARAVGFYLPGLAPVSFCEPDKEQVPDCKVNITCTDHAQINCLAIKSLTRKLNN